MDCLRVFGIALVGRGPEKSCGTRILGLAKDGAVRALAPRSGYSMQLDLKNLISLIISGHVCACRGAMAASVRAHGFDQFLNLIMLR